ncbi:DNA topoisomerase 2-binding protein 1, partial [Chondrus crispus]
MYQRSRKSRAKVLAGCVLTCSGVEFDSVEAVDSFCNRVSALGGTFEAEILPTVTHLICAEAGSTKHRDACLRNLEAGPDRSRMHIVMPSWLDAVENALARVPTGSHALPPLEGFSLCCSGYGMDEKQKIETLAREMGASFSKVLRVTCTHLICLKPTGQKYDFARSMSSMRVVTKEWVYQCAKEKLLVEEDLYLVNHRSRAAKTNNSETAPSARRSETLERQGGTASDGRAESSAAPSSIPSAAPTRTPSSVTKHVPQQERVSKWNETKPGLYLDGMTFYLTPCTAQEKVLHAPLRAKALKLIASGGGSLAAELTRRVNYVVLIRAPVLRTKIAELERAQRMGVAVVSLEWLERCVVKQCVVEDEEVDRYDWDAEEPNERSTQFRPQADFHSRLFVGMRCALGPLALYDTGAVAAVARKLQRGRGKVLPHDARGVVTSGVATHVVCGESLSAGGRRVVETAQKVNSHVVIVTTTWIDACLQEERLVPVTDCVLFAPVPHETPLREMLRRKVSVTITGHQMSAEREPNRRRDVLARLTRGLGAGYSERMTKGKTTHLIADARTATRSEKIEKAKRWGIAIVSYKWLLACAEAGDIVDAGDYAPDEADDKDALVEEVDAEIAVEALEATVATQPGRARSTARARRGTEAEGKLLG